MKEWMMAHPWLFFFMVTWGITIVGSVVDSVASAIISRKNNDKINEELK